MDWPVPFMAEELWLRARRTVISGLFRIGLGTTEADYQAYVHGQEALGHRLMDLLARRLGPEQYAFLLSERMAGPFTRRFAQRLPFTLAFAHSFADGLPALAGDGAGDSGLAGEGAALFNLAAVLVDLLADRLGLAGSLRAFLPEDRLNDLLTRPEAPRELGADLPAVEEPSLRVFGAVLACFLSAAHELCERGSALRLGEQLRASVVDAYRAELASIHPGAGAEEAISVGVTKSIGPFLVFSILVRLATGDRHGQVIHDLARTAGQAVGSVDDLADLESDLRKGHINAVLVRSGLEGRHSQDDTPAAMMRLLEGPEIDGVAAEVMASVRAAIDLVRVLEPFADARHPLLRWMAHYLIDWLR